MQLWVVWYHRLIGETEGPALITDTACTATYCRFPSWHTDKYLDTRRFKCSKRRHHDVGTHKSQRSLWNHRDQSQASVSRFECARWHSDTVGMQLNHCAQSGGASLRIRRKSRTGSHRMAFNSPSIRYAAYSSEPLFLCIGRVGRMVSDMRRVKPPGNCPSHRHSNSI
jgi:hypothetical protein